MLIRIISGIVGICLFLVICFAGLLPFTVAVAVIAAVAAAEFMRAEMLAVPVANLPAWAASYARLFQPFNPILTSIGLALIPLAYSIVRIRAHQPVEMYAAVISAAVIAGLLLVARAWHTGGMLGWFRAFYGKAGFWYIGALFSSFVLLRGMQGRIRVGGFAEADRGAWIMLFVAVCVWSTDSFAYFIGKSIGKHKLVPKLSPGKTQEGFIGGLVGGVIAGAIFGHWIGLAWSHGMIVGCIAGAVGPLGDLFESGLKRELLIKDFGSLIPGHGGALDRFDSLLFVAPLACLYLVLVGI